MKTIYLILLFCIGSLLGISQNDYGNTDQPKNEIRIDPFYFIFLNHINFSYEKLVNSSSSVGVNAHVSYLKKAYTNYPFILSPFYKLYMKGHCEGVFFEGNITAYSNNTWVDTYSPRVNFGIGFGVGYKLVRRSIALEFSGMLGRDLSSVEGIEFNKSSPIYGRLSVSIGKRF